MTDWATLEEYFRHLADLDPEHQARALEEINRDSPELAEQLRGMLAADEQTTMEIGERVQRMASSVLLDGELGTGDRIGPWSVLELIGRGGMGTVYKVERADEQFRQVAALKVVSNVADEVTYERFRRERQILAQLSHPNIAGLIDGGVIDDGRPWLVMEYVEGMRIDHWCDRLKLDIEDRLRLFMQVLDAVEFAHHKLVLHKDIKLANILVNDNGQVRLLDFGTASLLDDDADSPEAVTRIFALTPAFASPEQVRGEPLSTASDTYSLGVVLYWLLTGRMPLPDRARNAAEFERIVSLQLPERPSAAINGTPFDDDTNSMARIARCRNSTPAKLRARLRGDIDAIVMTCLRKEPDRRYASVQALRDDIHAYLHGRPVSARADSSTYRMGRFLRRNRWALGASTGLVLILVLSLVLTIQGYLQVKQHSSDLELVVDFHNRLIEGIEPRALGQEALSWLDRELNAEAMPGDPVDTVNVTDLGRRLLDRQILSGTDELIANTFDQRPELGQQMHVTMARLYRGLELHHGTINALKGAAAMAEKAGDPISALRMRAFLADTYHRLEDYDRVERILDELLTDAEQVPAGDGRDQLLAIALKVRGDMLETRGKLEEALANYRRSLEYRQALGDGHMIRVVLQDVAVTLSRLGRLDESLEVTEELIAGWEQAAGPEHPRTYAARNLKASLLSDLGHLDEALELQREIHQYRLDQLGSESQFTLVALNNIGVTHQRLGRLEQALDIFDEVYQRRAELFGESNSYTVATAMRRGETLKRMDRMEEAIAVFSRIIEVTDSEATGDSSGLLARLHIEDIRAGRGQPADPVQARQLFEQLDQASSQWRTPVKALRMLGRIHAANEDPAAAEQALREAIARQTGILGADHPDTLDTRQALARLVDTRKDATDPVSITPGPESF